MTSFRLAVGLFLLSGSVSAVELKPLVGLADSLHWSGPQFIQADGQGDVYLVRGDTLKVYPVTRAHDLGEPQSLDVRDVAGPLRDAALSPRGDWALLVGLEVRLVVDGTEKPVPSVPWYPMSVGFLRDDPVAIVTVPRNAEVVGSGETEIPPLLLRAAQNRWSVEIEASGSASDPGTEMANRKAFVLTEKQGRYFLAREYAYRIEIRRSGKSQPLEELRLGKGETLMREAEGRDQERVLATAAKQGMDTNGKHGGAFLGVAAIKGLALGPDGRLYVVTSAVVADGCALDRIDWDSQRVERTKLAGLSCEGRVSLAAGRDGLYFAPYNGRLARFFTSWTDLDTAVWSKAADMQFSTQPPGAGN